MCNKKRLGLLIVAVIIVLIIMILTLITPQISIRRFYLLYYNYKCVSLIGSVDILVKINLNFDTQTAKKGITLFGYFS